MSVRSGHARRAVLIGLVLFALAQVALAWVIVYQGLALRDPAYAYKVGKLKKRLADAPGALLVVGVGSSRMCYGLRGIVAEPWLAERLGRPVVLFNMGIFGAGPATELMNLRRLLDEGVRPDLVLIEVLPAFLTEPDRFNEPQLIALPARRLRHSEMRLLARHLPPTRDSVAHEWWQAFCVPIHGFRREILARLVPTLVSQTERWEMGPIAVGDDSGWIASADFTAEEQERHLACALHNYGYILQTFHLSATRVSVVRETIAQAHREGLAAALLLMPEGPKFRGLYPPAVAHQIDQTLLAISRESDTPLLDLRSAIGEEEFFDSHHLLPEGAARFTHCLARRIEPLLHLREGRP